MADSQTNQKRGRRSRLAYLGSLASGLAHEIKNPLSAMSINLQMMREDLERSERSQDRKLLKRVDVLEREVNRLEEILEGFLSFARGFSLKPKRHAMNDLLRQVIEFWAAKASSSNIDVELVLGNNLPDALVDPTYFKQALLNLLNNALQAIELQKDRVPGRDQIVLGSRLNAGQVEVLVIDNGPGIRPETLAKIFEPYYSTKAKGSGLGLATARRIMDEHGGRLLVESEVGRGTSFRMTLPLADGAHSEPDDEDAEGTDNRS